MLAMAEHGAKSVTILARNEETANQVISESQKLNPECEFKFVKLDLGDQKQVKQVVENDLQNKYRTFNINILHRIKQIYILTFQIFSVFLKRFPRRDYRKLWRISKNFTQNCRKSRTLFRCQPPRSLHSNQPLPQHHKTPPFKNNTHKFNGAPHVPKRYQIRRSKLRHHKIRLPIRIRAIKTSKHHVFKKTSGKTTRQMCCESQSPRRRCD